MDYSIRNTPQELTIGAATPMAAAAHAFRATLYNQWCCKHGSGGVREHLYSILRFSL
jgi:hypothetical protein